MHVFWQHWTAAMQCVMSQWLLSSKSMTLVMYLSVCVVCLYNSMCWLWRFFTSRYHVTICLLYNTELNNHQIYNILYPIGRLYCIFNVLDFSVFSSYVIVICNLWVVSRITMKVNTFLIQFQQKANNNNNNEYFLCNQIFSIIILQIHLWC